MNSKKWLKVYFIVFLISASGFQFDALGQELNTVKISIYPDSILSDVSQHPLGINLDYFMDDDKYLHPRHRLVDALKAMGVKYLRYPGGNKSDFYLFSKYPYASAIATLARTGVDAVGGRNRQLNATATDYKNDVLDFDEFMAVCHESGAEPVVVVAADEYLVNYQAGSTWSTRKQLLKNAVEWVRYANIKKQYGVKYWMIGNESWGPENKNSNVAIYAQDVLDFSIAMKAVDPAIKIIPNGNSDAWWKTVLTKDAGHIDALCLSNYPVYKLTHGYDTYKDSVINFIGPVTTAIKAIAKYASATDKVKLKVIAAEYGAFDWGNTWPFINNMGYNLANFEQTGQQLSQPGLLFSCFWNTRWITNDSVKYNVFDALDRDGNLNANGMGLMIWGKNLGKLMVKTTSTVHLRSFASYSPDTRRLYVYLINKSPTETTILPDLPGFNILSKIDAWELTSSGPDDVNPAWQKSVVLLPDGREQVKSTSIKVIQYQLK